MFEKNNSNQFPLTPLHELTLRITDGSHFSPTPQEYGYLIANVKDMKSGFIDFNSCTRMSEASYRELKSTGCTIRNGNVLLSKDGTVGRVVVYQQNDEIGALSSICIIEPSDKLLPAFLGHALQSDICIKQFENFMSGSAIRRLVLRDIRAIEVPNPSIEEQVAIAQVLDTLDTAIRETESIIDKLKVIKQGLLQDLLTRGVDANGELRPPQSEAPQLYKDSPLGWTPKEWDIGTTESYLNRIIDYRGKTPEKTESGIPLITARNVRLGYIDSEPCEFIAHEDFDRWMTRGIPQKGDILFTTEAPLGNLAQIETDNRLAFAQRVIILQAGPRIINTFLKYFMLGQMFRSRLFALGSGSTVEGIQQSTFRRLLITVPESLFEQEIIIQKLTEMDSKINSESKYAAKLKQTKSGLMNDLLTGHVRVTPLLETTTL
ncbi:restriction endonuclease subunit S [Pseudomonas farris]